MFRGVVPLSLALMGDLAALQLDYNIPEPVCKVRNLELGKSYQFRVRAENIYGISEPSPASPPSQLMAPPKPVLDRHKRPILLLDPYTLSALDKAHAEQYGQLQFQVVLINSLNMSENLLACAPWFAPRESDKAFCGENDTLEIIFFVYGYPDPDVKWTFRGWDLDTTSPTSRFRYDYFM